MASKRRLRRNACKGKVRHANRENAMKAIWAARYRDWMNPYRCTFCGCWHVGRANTRIF
jgi:hypothetical protein